ncbi:MAG: hypothetical protein KAH18_08530 [Psychromonas sp.]|nr:hypothetical protein [Psychromonas sp.]
MISSKTKPIDRFTTNNEGGAKLVSIPEWLKNTNWSVPDPFEDDSIISVNESDLSLNILDPTAATGLIKLSVDTLTANKIINEQTVPGRYSLVFTTASRGKIVIDFMKNQDEKTAQLTFFDVIVNLTFNITKK